MTDRRLYAPLTLVAILMSAGCAPADPAASPAPAEATPTHVVSPTAGPVWTVAFGSDCENMLSPADLDSLLGPDAVDYATWLAAVSPEQAAPPTPPGPEGTAGGLRCSWVSGTDAYAEAQFLSLFSLPESQVDPALAASLVEPVCGWDYDTRVCRQAAAADGVWVMSSVSHVAEEEPLPTDLLRGAVEAALRAASAFPAGVAALASADRWPIVACAQLAERMGLADVLGEDHWSGYWEGSRQTEEDLWEHAGVRQFCQFGTGESRSADGYHIVSVTSEPGGAWLWDRVSTEGRVPVSVPGAGEALRGEGGGADAVDLISGTNALRVTVTGGAIAPEIAARAVAALAG